MSRVTLMDTGTNNLLSVQRALHHVGAEVVVCNNSNALTDAERLILPGVGTFGACTRNLKEMGLNEAVLNYARLERPLLGICVGMQMLFDGSEAFGWNDGLGLIAGSVRAIPEFGADGSPHNIPHIGWASLAPGAGGWAGTIFDSMGVDLSVYFVHSFSAHPKDGSDILAVTNYNGLQLVAAAGRGMMIGTQFHPEKSGQTGLDILSRFLDM